MAYNLGTAEGVITTSYNGKGVEAANKDIAGLEKGSLSTSAALGKVGTASGVAGAAIAVGFGLAVNAAADFEQRMSAVQAVSGASQKEMDQLSSKALQLGKDTSFSATEAASAIEELVKAGVSVPDVMNGAADATVALAAAGEVSLPEAAAIASNAMNQFNLSAQDMPKIADLIAGAANASAIDVKDFGFSLSQVGAVANLAGVSFADTATAIALMGNAGIKGSDAGTSLKTMLSNLQPSTEKQTTLMQKLGLMTESGANAFYDAQGNLKSFSEIAGLLQNSLKGMTAAQKQAALETLFGSDAIRAAAIFANQGATGFTNMAASMQKVKAADVAKTRLDNFKGSLEAMKGSLETTGIVIGQILLPALRSIVDGVTGVANAFLNLSPSMQQNILVITGVVGAALLLVAATVKIVQAIQTVIAVVKALRIAFALMWATSLGPPLIIIALIALLIAAIVLLWQRSETFRNIVLGVWEAIKTAVQAVVNFFTGTVVPALQAAWNAVIAALQAVGNFFKSVWNGIVSFLTSVFDVIKTIISTYINIWITIFTTVFGVLQGWWKTFWGIFGGVITAAFKLIEQVIKLGLALWSFIINTTMKAIQKFFTAIWNAIVKDVTAKFNTIKSVATSVWNAIKSFLSAVGNAIKNDVTSKWNAIKNAVISAINAVKGPVQSAVNAVKSAVSTAWNAVKSATTSAWNSLVGIVGPKIDAVYNKVRTVVDRIRGIFNSAKSWLYNAGRDIIQGLLNGIESLINSVTSKLKSLTDKIPKVKGPEQRDKKLLKPAGKWIMEGFITELDKGIVRALATLRKTTDMIPDTMTARSISEVIPPTGIRPAASLVPQHAAQIRERAAIYLTTYNPVGKTTAEELNDQATRLATLGVLR